MRCGMNTPKPKFGKMEYLCASGLTRCLCVLPVGERKVLGPGCASRHPGCGTVRVNAARPRDGLGFPIWDIVQATATGDIGNMMGDTNVRAGQCHCGTVRFEATLSDGFNSIRRCTCS